MSVSSLAEWGTQQQTQTALRVGPDGSYAVHLLKGEQLSAATWALNAQFISHLILPLAVFNIVLIMGAIWLWEFSTGR